METATINQSKLRIGNFTSSEIVALTTNPTAKAQKEGAIFGAPALTYIEECNMERRLGRSLTTETNARPTTWGKLVEARVLETLLGTAYIPLSTETIQHPEIEYWAGSPDALTDDAVCDVKCPLTLKSFCNLVDCSDMNAIRDNHKDGEKYYWQLVSNAIITGKPFAELIVYAPYQSELAAIRELAQNFDGDQNKVAWTNWATDEDLPYLIDGGYYKNLNVIRFEIPQSDKDFLTQRVIEAGKLLIKPL